MAVGAPGLEEKDHTVATCRDVCIAACRPARDADGLARRIHGVRRGRAPFGHALPLPILVLGSRRKEAVAGRCKSSRRWRVFDDSGSWPHEPYHSSMSRLGSCQPVASAHQCSHRHAACSRHLPDGYAAERLERENEVIASGEAFFNEIDLLEFRAQACVRERLHMGASSARLPSITDSTTSRPR